MSWRRAAEAVSSRHGFPPAWVDAFDQEHPEIPPGREGVRAYETWCLARLAGIWSGKIPDSGLDGQLAAYLVQRYLADSARVLAHRYRLSEEEWEDLVASAGERAMRVFSERHIEAPQAYLFRTVQRAIWEYLRKARRELAVAELPLAADTRPDPEKHAAWRQLVDRFMQNCYRKLSEDDRQLLEALEVHGLSAAEAGAPLGLVANAVNVRKFRIRKRLRDCLRDWSGLPDVFDS